MGTLSPFSPFLSISPISYQFLSRTQTHLANFVSLSKIDQITPKFRGGAVLFVKKSSETNGSQFLDENGVVDDMDGYLNHLSLEYDSVWDTKPSWCQPWTITTTGVSIIASSWLIAKSVAVTAVVLSSICIWWYIFLYSYPKAYSEMIAERRKKVTNGDEDTFGLRKTP